MAHSKRSRKGRGRGLSGMSGAALADLAAALVKCTRRATPAGKVNCTMSVVRGYKPKGRRAAPAPARRGGKRTLPPALRVMQFTKADAAGCKGRGLPPKQFALCMGQARALRLGSGRRVTQAYGVQQPGWPAVRPWGGLFGRR